MFRGNALAAVPAYKLILGFSLCTLGCAMLYAYFKTTRDEEEDEDKEVMERQSSKDKKGLFPLIKKRTSASQNESLIQLTISNEHIPLVVGRSGANLSIIEEKTRTSIRFKDKDETHKLCEIRGLPVAVSEARALLLKEIERSPIVKEEIYVPQSVCGKIVGRCGEAMQEICRLSLAKVSVDTGGRNGATNKRRIIITGNRSQVNIARKLIEDKIDEDEEVRKAVEEVEQKREPRRSPTTSVCSSMYSSQTSLNSHIPSKEKLPAAANEYDKPMEVYVSAIASPAKFWVQLIGPQSKKLDDMVQAMTEYYGLKENQAKHRINEPYLGQIVAVVFKYDGKWYRAEIVGILPNEYNPSEMVLDLYFVDYGDSEYVGPHEVYELRTDFLTLRFQAVECFLANIKSTTINDPDNWDQQSIQKFEELTQVANWKKLVSRVVTYKERPKVDSTNRREGSPVPGVELVDFNDGAALSIGDILISQGYAVPDNQTTQSNDVLRLGGGDSPMNQSLKSATLPRTNSNENITTTNGTKTTTTTENPTIVDPTTTDDLVLQKQLHHMQSNNNSDYTNGTADAAALTNGSSAHKNGSAAMASNGSSSSHSSQDHWNGNGKLFT